MTGGGASSQSIAQTAHLSTTNYFLNFYYKSIVTGSNTVGLSAVLNGTTVFSTTTTATSAYIYKSITVKSVVGANTLAFNFTSTDTNSATYVIDEIVLSPFPQVSIPVKVNTPITTANVQSALSLFAQNMAQVLGGGNQAAQRAQSLTNVTAGYAEERSLSPQAAEARAAIDDTLSKPANRFGNWQVWASATGAGSSSSNATGSTTTSRSGGAVVATEYLGFKDTKLGVSFSGAGANWGISDGSGGGSSNNFMAAAYLNSWYDDYYIGAAGMAGQMWTHTNRYDATFGQSFEAEFSAPMYGGRLEAGHRFNFNTFTVIPYAAAQFLVIKMPSYAETVVNGSASNALASTSGQSVSTRTELGSWFGAPLPMAVPVSAFGKLAWAHDTNGSNIATGFLTDPSTNIVADTSSMPKNFALVTSGLQFPLSHAVNLSVKFDGQFAKGYRGYAGSGTLTYALN
ncbi:MAG: hypothetical protein GC182_10695 [Rhodopseudomonas sp.]|nr:hypothetical protein [Rhodopseudomonas sp.]